MQPTVQVLTFTLLMLSCFVTVPSNAKKKNSSLILEIDDQKELKKILRTKTNLLIIFAKSESAASKSMGLFEEVAEEMKGKATLALVDCSEAKKLCKNMKASPSSAELLHYKDGEFNKVYDRKMVKKSMVNFLLDPTGDIPWDEEPGAEDVVHVESEQSFNKFLKREKNPVLAMFYAPWCGFCKKLKPDFAAAASEMKGKAALVGIDVEKPNLVNLRTEYNITGFPTLYYFKEGRVKYRYGGENNKDGIISWLNDPKPPEEPKKEKEWADDETDVVHLHDDDFDDFINTHNSVMVMFYAPWCGHCKKMKPEYEAAAAALKAENIEAVLAAVDATKEKRLGTEYKIQGFPTGITNLTIGTDGAFAWDFNERTADKFLEHMKNPTEPPPPPPMETKWEEIESDVVHLTDENFKNILKKKKHALVMFYAPWCGHCKKAKPEYMQAAAKYKDDNKVVFAAIDCTTHNTMCTSHDVTGYPTFKYFNYGKNEQKYMGGVGVGVVGFSAKQEGEITLAVKHMACDALVFLILMYSL
ncbi:hypothetical protein CHS0354_016566 [Potamilus streckersoni]|uniref:Thioredoxin domain-containing protein n=1 Tax=Potamilus streckersoni TaxID=2493646 RepID=A0AAE0WFR5_9BIVA|nr:hypothetical protein CHS0354_016566 [Potamilus streckersoni]